MTKLVHYIFWFELFNALLFAQSENSKVGFRNLKDIGIVVDVYFKGDQSEINDLKERLRNDAELKLRVANIAVNEYADGNTLSPNYIFISVIILELKNDNYSFYSAATNVSLKRIVKISDNNLNTYGAVWDDGIAVFTQNTLGDLNSSIREIVKDSIDDFTIEYLKANKKPR